MPSSPPSETHRLAALARYDVLDGLPGKAFSTLAALAARALRARVGMINFVTEDATLTRACFGADLGQMDRPITFCSTVVATGELTVIPDLTRDERFEGHPLVTSDGGVRFYAGAPLVTPDGHVIGTLCVLDHTAREDVTSEQLDTLVTFAGLVMDELELRRTQSELERQHHLNATMLVELRRAKTHAETLLAVASLADLDLDASAVARHAAQLISHAVALDWAGLGVARNGVLTVETLLTTPTLPQAVLEVATRTVHAGENYVWQVLERGGVVFVDDYTRVPNPRPEILNSGTRAVAWLPLGAYGAEQFVLCAVRTTPEGWSASDRSLLRAATNGVASALNRRASLDATEREARQDLLTGLGNRRAFELALTQQLGEPTGFALALLDLDGFKRVNDTFGHERGDALLRLFGQALVASLDSEGAAFRFGGDEFALLVPAGEDELEVLLEDRVLVHVDDAVGAVRGAGFEGVGVSTGVVVCPRDGRERSALLARADERMYARKHGREGASPPTPRAADPARARPERR